MMTVQHGLIGGGHGGGCGGRTRAFRACGGGGPFGGPGKGQAQALSEWGQIALRHPLGERKEVGRNAGRLLQARKDLANLRGLAAGFWLGRDGHDKPREGAASERDAYPHPGGPASRGAVWSRIRKDAVEAAGDGYLEVLGCLGRQRSKNGLKS